MLSKRFLFSQAPLFRSCGQRSRLSLKFLFVMVFVGILFQFWAGGFSLATCLGGKMKTQRTYTMFFLHFQVSLWSSFFFPPVLISQDCHNKQPQARWFKEKREFILSQVWSWNLLRENDSGLLTKGQDSLWQVPVIHSTGLTVLPLSHLRWS